MRTSKVIILFCYSVFFAACSEAKLNEGVSIKSSILHDANQTGGEPSQEAISKEESPAAALPGEVLAPAASLPVVSQSTIVDVPSVPAITPTVLAGASLACSLVSSGAAQCLAKTPQGAPFDFAAVRAFLVQGASSPTWTPTAFTQVSSGIWTIDTKGASGSFGLAIQDIQNQTMADWIISPAQPPLNLVTDGGFESLIRFDRPNDQFQFVMASPDLPWQIRLAPNTEPCNSLYIEVQMARSQVVPAEGKRFVELNSACKDTGLDRTSPLIMSQSIKKLTIGNLYEVRLSYMRRLEYPEAVGFRLTFGVQILTETSVSQASWMEYRSLIKAQSTESLLSIEELTRHSLGFGTAIDNVRIIDLGSGKE